MIHIIILFNNIINLSKKNNIQSNIDYLNNINSQEINSIIDFLYKSDYITFNDSVNIFNLDTNNYFNHYNDLIITQKGTVAKQIAECNEILLTEIIINKLLHNLSQSEIIAVLSIFIEEKTIEGENITLYDLDIPTNCINVIKQIKSLSTKFEHNESQYHLNTKTDWNINLEFIQPAYMWIQKNLFIKLNIIVNMKGILSKI